MCGKHSQFSLSVTIINQLIIFVNRFFKKYAPTGTPLQRVGGGIVFIQLSSRCAAWQHTAPQGLVRVCAFLNFSFDRFTDTIKIPIYLDIWKPYHFQIIFFKNISSYCVIGNTIFGIVLISVKFNNKFCLEAEKINYESVNWTLSIPFDRIIPQKIIPQMLLLLGHIFS